MRIYFADELLLKRIRARDFCLNDLIYNTYLKHVKVYWSFQSYNPMELD